MKIRVPVSFVLIFAILSLAIVCGCSSVGSNNVDNSNQSISNSTTVQTPSYIPASDPKETKSQTLPRGSVRRISFEAGKSAATVSDSVIRGERVTYVLGAKSGQTMSVTIISEENNAVFQITNPSGKFMENVGDGDDAMSWSGELSASGDYKIIVGGTSGNSTYKLTVMVR